MFRRAGLSIRRKLSRTVILMLILFAMANLVLATVAIQGAVRESTEYAKESLGGTVYLSTDIDALHEKMMEGMTGGGTTQIGRMTRPEVPVETAKAIANSEYVKDYSYGLSATANASDFTAVATEESERMKALEDQLSSTREQLNFGGGARTGGGASTTEIPTLTRGDITISGINSFAFIADVESGNMKLSDGAIFDETTADSLVISFTLATQNNLSVGDTITLNTTENATPIALKIIGIYENTTDNFDANTVYMNTDTAAKFLSADAGSNYGVQGVKYYLTNAEHKDAFIAEANAKYPSLKEDGLTLDIDDSAYQTMIGPIESVGSFATTIFWIVLVASVAIITLMVTINVKDRRYEMGVLMSLGATRQNVIGQILTEVLVVGTVAFVLSIGTSTFLARGMSQSLLNSQLEQSQTTETATAENNFGRGQRASGGMSGMMQQMRDQFGNGNNSNAEVIKEINVNASLADYAILFGVGYLIIILSLIVPAVNVVRYEPKTILSGKE
jgi:putative ABC transport system permease protein